MIPLFHLRGSTISMKKKSDFDFSLDFKPHAKWPLSLPAIAIGNFLIAGFATPDDHPVHVHTLGTTSKNSELFVEVYAQLSLPEIARLTKIPAAAEAFDLDLILKGQHLHPSDDLKNVLRVLASTPTEFQQWVATKKPGYHELLPLIDLSAEEVKFVADQIAEAQDSKTEGVQKIEFLSDLLQMEHKPENLEGLSLSEVRRIRYPITTERDEALSTAELHWPKSIRSQFSRRGDKGGFDIQFFAGTPLELTKTAQHLMKVAEQWNLSLDKNS